MFLIRVVLNAVLLSRVVEMMNLVIVELGESERMGCRVLMRREKPMWRYLNLVTLFSWSRLISANTPSSKTASNNIWKFLLKLVSSPFYRSAINSSDIYTRLEWSLGYRYVCFLTKLPIFTTSFLSLNISNSNKLSNSLIPKSRLYLIFLRDRKRDREEEEERIKSSILSLFFVSKSLSSNSSCLSIWLKRESPADVEENIFWKIV
jgi:hypothetical protein